MEEDLRRQGDGPPYYSDNKPEIQETTEPLPGQNQGRSHLRN